MANKSKDLLILGALGAAAAAGYFYYEKEMEKDHVPEGCQPQTKNETQDKSADKKPSPPGTEAAAKTTKTIEEKK